MERTPAIKFFESIPAILAWTTLISMVVASRFIPTWAAVFIIIFDTYWLFKTIFMSFHLRFTFNRMRENLKVDWLKELELLESSEALELKTTDSLGKLPKATIQQLGQAKSDQTAGMPWRDIYHLVILPMYKESYEVVEESFETLRNMNYPKDKLIVVLATEARAGEEARHTAAKIKEKFGNDFYKFLVSTHPADIEGELPGKGSNETWAAKEVKREVIDPLGLKYENILISVFDVDTQVPPGYFARLVYCFLSAEHPQRSSYQPIPLFNNNIYEAPLMARVVALSASFWQMVQQARPEKLTTFSSHSMPFKALVEVGFWETDLVSEDSRIFWQCFLHYDGDWRVVPMLYPVSMDANVASTFWGTLRNIYAQQRRWAWGAENVPYVFAGFAENKNISFKTKLYWIFNKIEGFHSWATNAILILALGWLPLILGGSNFNETLLSFNLPEITRFIMTLAALGIVSSALLGVVLLPQKPEWFRRRHYALHVFQWVLMPFTLIVFGAFPALEAQTRLALGGRFRLGFWVTPKSRG